jgi:hypothetical protein
MPLMRKVAKDDGEVIVNVLAPASKTIPFSVTLDERETLVTLEDSKVAISDGPFGTVGGVQLPGVFQSPLAGLRFQVALPASNAMGFNKIRRPAKPTGDSSRRMDFITKAEFVLKHRRVKRRKFTGLLLLAKLSSPALGCGGDPGMAAAALIIF